MPLVSKDASGNRLEQSTSSWATEVVAGFGTVIGNATQLGDSVGISIVTGGDDTVGVKLPVAQPGKVLVVYSTVASKDLNIYPQVNSTINGGTANAAFVVEGGAANIFIGTSSTNWGAIANTTS